MIYKTTSYARAGLIGNPSDGYFGKTIAFTFKNFKAEVHLWESPEIQFQPGHVDDAAFPSMDRLLKDISLYGYYGGVRLLKATAKVLIEYCRDHEIQLPRRNFTVRYRSNIPRLVGLGGSSALCTAMFKALLNFYEIDVPQEIIPTLCLHAETRELNIQAGLQDRVIQVYNGVMFMNFNEQLVTERGYGTYSRVDPALLPYIYVAYDPDRAEVSGTYHRNLRVLFDQKDETMVEAMKTFANLAQEANDCLLAGRKERLADIVDRNFDLRDRIFKVAPSNRRMVFAARKAGASAKFAGSGGAIVGTYDNSKTLKKLETNLKRINCRLLIPEIPLVGD